MSAAARGVPAGGGRAAKIGARGTYLSSTLSKTGTGGPDPLAALGRPPWAHVSRRSARSSGPRFLSRGAAMDARRNGPVRAAVTAFGAAPPGAGGAVDALPGLSLRLSGLRSPVSVSSRVSCRVGPGGRRDRIGPWVAVRPPAPLLEERRSARRAPALVRLGAGPGVPGGAGTCGPGDPTRAPGEFAVRPQLLQHVEDLLWLSAVPALCPPPGRRGKPRPRVCTSDRTRCSGTAS